MVVRVCMECTGKHDGAITPDVQSRLRSAYVVAIALAMTIVPAVGGKVTVLPIYVFFVCYYGVYLSPFLKSKWCNALLGPAHSSSAKDVLWAPCNMCNSNSVATLLLAMLHLSRQYIPCQKEKKHGGSFSLRRRV